MYERTKNETFFLERRIVGVHFFFLKKQNKANKKRNEKKQKQKKSEKNENTKTKIEHII